MQFSIVWQQTLILATKVTIDLDFLGERSLQQELAEADFAAEKPSLFVAEGLIMYLGPEGILSSSSVMNSAWTSVKSSGALYHCVSLCALAKTFVKTREIQTTFSGEKSCKTIQIASNSKQTKQMRPNFVVSFVKTTLSALQKGT